MFGQGLNLQHGLSFLAQYLLERQKQNDLSQAMDRLNKASYETNYVPSAPPTQTPLSAGVPNQAQGQPARPFGPQPFPQLQPQLGRFQDTLPMATGVTPVTQQVSQDNPDYQAALMSLAALSPQLAQFREQQMAANQPRYNILNQEGGGFDIIGGRPGEVPKVVGSRSPQFKPQPTLLRSVPMTQNGVTKQLDIYGYKDPSGKEVVTEQKYSDFTPPASQGMGDPNAELSPREKAIVKAIKEYRFQLPSGTALRTPYWQKIIGAVTNEDPAFDATQYPTRQSLRRDFTSGKAANNIRSLNTVAQHLDKLDQLKTSLENGDMPAFNSIKNFISKQTGSPKVTNFSSAANAVANEAVTVFKNTGATDQEIEHLRGIINENSSPSQIGEYIKTVMDLVNGRINALKSQYEQGMGKPVDFKMLDESTKQAFQKRGILLSDIGGGGVPSDEDINKMTPEQLQQFLNGK